MNDINADDRIRAILRLEADTVDPSPAGWDAIQRGVAARRRRTWWIRGSALAGAVATVTAVALVMGTDGGTRSLEQPPASAPPSGGFATNAATPRPSLPAGPADTVPLGTIWPLTTHGELRAWQADRSTYPSLSTQRDSALAFARNYLGVGDASVSEVADTTWAVTRPDPNGAPHEVTRVTLNGFGDGAGAPFLVTFARSASLTLVAPGAPVSSPLTVRGTYEGVEPAIDVRVRADGPGSRPVELASARATTAPPNGWSTRLTYTTTATQGSLLVTNASTADSGIAAATAVPVTFAAQGSTAPATFVGVRDGRVALFSAKTGKVQRFLTAAEPGGGVTSAELSEDGRTVLYAQGAGTCAGEVRSVPIAGGIPTTVVASPGDAVVVSASRRGDVLAYRRTRCGAGGATEVVVVRGRGEPDVTPVDGSVVAGPVLGERFVAFVTKKGAATTLHLVDSLGELADAPTAPPSGCAWTAATWGTPDTNDRETVVAAARCGTQDESGATRLFRLDADGRNRVLLGEAGSLNVTSLDYARGYRHLLLGALDSGDPDAYDVYSWEPGQLRQIGAAEGAIRTPTWQ